MIPREVMRRNIEIRKPERIESVSQKKLMSSLSGRFVNISIFNLKRRS